MIHIKINDWQSLYNLFKNDYSVICKLLRHCLKYCPLHNIAFTLSGSFPIPGRAFFFPLASFSLSPCSKQYLFRVAENSFSYLLLHFAEYRAGQVWWLKAGQQWINGIPVQGSHSGENGSECWSWIAQDYNAIRQKRWTKLHEKVSQLLHISDGF